MANSMTVEGVEEILQGFSRLSTNVQRKYLGAAVRAASKDEIPEIKALTPRGPTGNLRRSVGFKLEQKKQNRTAVGILGYRSKKGGSNRELGFHAWWIAEGVATRTPKGRYLKIPLAYARKYPYLQGKVSSIGGNLANVFFYEAYGFQGDGKFQAWANANLPQIKERLVGQLDGMLGKAIAEEERRQIRRIHGRR